MIMDMRYMFFKELLLVDVFEYVISTFNDMDMIYFLQTLVVCCGGLPLV